MRPSGSASPAYARRVTPGRSVEQSADAKGSGVPALGIVVWVVFVAAPRTPRAAYFLLFISSLSVLAPMVLAVFWAVSQYTTYVAALSIPDMARVHGTLNAFGFVTCGLVGWRLAASSQPASQPAGAT